jgi:hypothetical protein
LSDWVPTDKSVRKSGPLLFRSRNPVRWSDLSGPDLKLNLKGSDHFSKSGPVHFNDGKWTGFEAGFRDSILGERALGNELPGGGAEPEKSGPVHSRYREVDRIRSQPQDPISRVGISTNGFVSPPAGSPKIRSGPLE